jgi:hypothetical protein
MLIPPNVAAAAVKSAGAITAAGIGHYRPTGVPRTGSREDRAAAYQRLTDAAVAAYNNHYLWRDIRVHAGKEANRLLESYLPTWWAGGTELIAAVFGVRMRGTVQVITAAEALVTAISTMSINEDDDTVFQEGVRGVIAAQKAFLDVARADLAYDARWWQITRRRAERKFLDAQKTPEVSPAAELAQIQG